MKLTKFTARRKSSFLNSCRMVYAHAVEKRYPVVSSVIVGTAVVLFWRGIWGIFDVLLFPENEVMSYVLSMALGIVILIVHDGTSRIEELE